MGIEKGIMHKALVCTALRKALMYSSRFEETRRYSNRYLYQGKAEHVAFFPRKIPKSSFIISS
jgi:hypothetical protein